MTQLQTMTWKGREGLTNLSEEINYDRLSYDELLRFARGSAKAMIPRMCAALKRENPHYSNYDIREIVTKDCIEIWQRATIRDALPDEYKDKVRQEVGRAGNEAKYGSGSEQAAEFAPSDENGNNLRDSNLAKSSSVGPVEDVSEDFSKMNRGQDVITEKERAKMLSKELEEAEVERNLLKRENADLKNQVKTLSEKNIPDLLKEMQEKFADQKGILDSKKLQKISMDAGKNLMILVERYNSILQEAVERGKPVPFGTYILTKPELKLVPIRIMVDFNSKRIWVELWEKRLQSLT
jgi:hypothetical protein